MTHLKQIRAAQPTQDGAGVKIRRIHDFGGSLDPFLMVDELKASVKEDYIGGFPPHPHRGFETLTYIIHGGLTHEDSMGNKGEVHAGDAQWMSAGHGVIHSEMPLTDSDGLHGFQIWINLPAKRKLDAPRYKDLRAAEMGQLDWQGGQIKSIAGTWQTHAGEVQGGLPQLGEGAAMADLQLEAGQTFKVTLNPNQQLLAYVYQGSLNAGVKTGQLGTFVANDQNQIELTSEEASGLLLMTGPALKEPVVHYGPFVMNTEEEIHQAIKDYQTGQLTQIPVVE
ncbi:hypothetical protein SAMN05660443_1570 [Marinospirillum celere]|uniref:Pirin N-terminal domain-containing protein n=1 Tax=Marinospirillum celere TaxID=1122252 RepID=A0A1I1GX76_9GAMM|nr:pirin family protein [Marinospirillum celere]SFC13773.1 hypothetical protein SAMN05660443_1570 [Marinospirillum celere]